MRSPRGPIPARPRNEIVAPTQKDGRIELGDNGYFTANKNAKNSTCAWSASNTVLTITLQGVSSAGTVAGTSTATWTGHQWMTSASGEAIDLTQIPTVTVVLFQPIHSPG
jgi:hypothetical protein